jgi:hypothetical protein
MARRFVALLAVSAMVALAACGDDDAETTTAGAETTTGTETTTDDGGATDDGGTTDDGATTDDSEATDDGGVTDDGGATDGDGEGSEDQQAAEAALLTLDDLPEGFQQQPTSEDEGDDELLEELASCIGVDPAMFDRGNPEASASFGSPTGQQVNSEVTYTASTDEAMETMEAIRNEDTPGCLEDIFEQQMQEFVTEAQEAQEAEGVPVTDAEITDVSVDTREVPDMGDDSAGLTVTITFTEQGQDLTITMDMIVVRVDRVGVSMMFQGLNEPFPADQAEELTQTVVDRIEV